MVTCGLFTGGEIGLAGGLTIIFVILKLCDVISWKWVWVLSPLWIDLILHLIGAIIVTFLIVS